MSLEFLSKKSWHTKNLGNQEKVWLAEQRASQEEGRVKELQKQIQLEREQEELDRITGGDKKQKNLDKGIDWMYSEGGGMKDTNEVNDDFLMGKKFTERDFINQIKKHDGKSANEGMDLILGSVAGSTEKPLVTFAIELKEPATLPENNLVGQMYATKNDGDDDALDRNKEFHLRHEDPMDMVSMRRKEMEDNLKKKKALLERVSGRQVVAVSKETHAVDVVEHGVSDNRNSRTSRKEHKTDSRRRSRSREDIRRRESTSRERKKHRSDTNETVNHNLSSSKNSSRYKHLRREDKYRNERHVKQRKHDRRRRSRSFSSQSSSSTCSSSSSVTDRKHRRKNTSKRHKETNTSSSNSRPVNCPVAIGGLHQDKKDAHNTTLTTYETDAGREKMPGFGLQNASLKGGLDSLGPAKELLEQKRKESSIKKNRTTNSSHVVTAEERAILLAQMQADADFRRSTLDKALLQKRHDD